MTIRETPTYTLFDDVTPDDDAIDYRSVPGRGGGNDRRRIDVSSGAQLRVTFYRILVQRDGNDMTMLGRFVLMRGVPLVWPVPYEASADDILVVIELRDTLSADIHVSDHWRAG